MPDNLSLSPCPWCGAAPDVRSADRWTGVFCNNMDCAVEASVERYHGWDHRQQAIAAWNRRPSEAAPQDVAAIEAIPSYEDRVARLRRALAPFSTALGDIAPSDRDRWPDNETIEMSGAAEEITWGDLREARAVIEAIPSYEPVEALRELRRGLDMIHNGLMDPTRPRQAVGEVCAYWLGEADKYLSTRKHKMRSQDNGAAAWYYWTDPEVCHGPCSTRDAAIGAGRVEFGDDVAFEIAAGRRFKLRPPCFDDWFADAFDDINEDSADPDGRGFADGWDSKAYRELCDELEAVATRWLAEHGYDQGWALDLELSEAIAAADAQPLGAQDAE